MENEKERNSFQEMIASIVPILLYVLKRLLIMIPILLVISLLLYLICHSMPGDPLASYIDMENPDPTLNLDALREMYGLNDPWYVQYTTWIKELLKGNLGYSITLKRMLVDFLPYYLKNSLMLNIFAFILAFAVAIVVGIKSAVKRYSAFDNFWTVFSIFGISMPSFFMAMILLFVFVINLGWFPFSGMVDPKLDLTGFAYTLNLAHHMVLPVVVIALGAIASLVRYVRNAMLEVLKQDYIRTAKSKGLKDKVVIYRHAFRNALLPVVTLVGQYIPALFGGSLLVEKIFVWPGIGNLLNSAYASKDRQIILCVTLFYAALTLLANVIVDVSYALVDPRVRVGGGSNNG